MPRNSSGTYTLPSAAFVPGGLIKSADENANFSDIATAITQSLATTGVSTMTGQLKGAAGTVAAPGYCFNGGTTSGFYLAGASQIGVAVGGVNSALFNSDTSMTWVGSQTWSGGTWTVNATSVSLVSSFRTSMLSALNSNISIELLIDGLGSAITTGVKGFIEIPVSCTVNRWTVAGDVAGSIVVDIWRANGAVPTVANTIAGTSLPTLSAAQYATNTSLTGWTTTLAPQDIIGFNVNSATTVTKATVSITALRT